MANRFTTFRKRNKNRWKKIYPINHFPAVPGFTSDKSLVVETKVCVFDNQDNKTVSLDGEYSSMPSIVISSYSTSSGSNENVNLFISNMILDNGFVLFTISASASFSGTVSIQAIEVGV